MPNEPHTVRAPMVNVSQSELEQVMADTVAAHPLVTLHWGARVTGVTQSMDEAILEVATTADGVRTLRAGWVVAADGGAAGCARRRACAPGPQLRGPLRHRRHPLGVRPPRRADGGSTRRATRVRR